MRRSKLKRQQLLKHKSEIRGHAAEIFLSGVTVCPFDRNSAKKAASLYEKLESTGKMINENDLLLAGISLANNEILLTRDKKVANVDDERIKII